MTKQNCKQENQDIIERVKDNNDQYCTYQVNMEKYKKARDNGYFYEAIVIDYAYLEDRLFSFLYHCGLVNTRMSKTIDNKEALDCITPISPTPNKQKKNSNIKIDTISTKLRTIRLLLEWARDTDVNQIENPSQVILKNTIVERIDIPGTLKTLEDINNWKPSRNGITHSLMTKNIFSVEENIEQLAIQGMPLGQFIATQVKRLKKDDAIRKAFHLTID